MTDKIYVTKSSLPPLDEFVSEIADVWETHWLTNMGVKHQLLQAKLQEFLGVRHVALFTNGHLALEMALQAMDLAGEVITTPFTFASTTHAIVRNGMTPVFCDVDPDTFTLDVCQLESLITEKTCAIVPVHVYGNICDVEAIDRIAKKHNLKVLYDAAHAFGVRYKGRGIGSFGDASMFSFHATKVFHTIEGGAVCYNDEGLDQVLYQLKNFGIRDEQNVDTVGANGKMSEIQAAMGLCNLRHLPDNIKRRKQVFDLYMHHLQGVSGLRLPALQENVEPNYAYFPIIVEEDCFGITRDALYELLKSNNIYARKYFYPLTSSYACYQGQFNPQETPVALALSQEVLTLPFYPDLSTSQIEYICRVIREK